MNNMNNMNKIYTVHPRYSEPRFSEISLDLVKLVKGGVYVHL